jgi:hypothetical protein
MIYTQPTYIHDKQNRSVKNSQTNNNMETLDFKGFGPADAKISN